MNQPFDWSQDDGAAMLVAAYCRDGYAVARGVFSEREVAELAAAFDRCYAEGLRHGRSFRHGNLLYRLGRDANLGTVVRLVQWAVWVDPVLDRYRLDPRIARILQPLIGGDLKQIINQLHWKPPGAAQLEFGFHQDSRFRRPASAYRNLGDSYVQTGIAVDAHAVRNGAMFVLPGSHRLGPIDIGDARAVMDQAMNHTDLCRAGLNPAGLVDLELAAGDLALWHPYLVHGSGRNRSADDRRLYINGYVRAADCDRGEWAFRGGRPVPLPPTPSLVHYEALHQRPGPHYTDE